LLDQLGIMDYSLLVGIHDRRRLQKVRTWGSLSCGMVCFTLRLVAAYPLVLFAHWCTGTLAVYGVPAQGCG
jgi:hypothetical protein